MKKIVYVINVDWFFVSHFLPVAKEAIQKGYEVHIACGFTDQEEYLKTLGLITHPLDISRSGTTLIQELKVIMQIYKILQVITPDIVEFFTIKPILYGGIATHFIKTKRKIFYLTGLGYIFTRRDFIGNIIKYAIQSLYRIAIYGKNSYIITENNHDKILIEKLGVIETKHISIIKGAGVKLKNYPYKKERKRPPLKVVMASRLLKDKGVLEYAEASKRIIQNGYNAKFLLYGDIDIHNPTSLTPQELEKIKKDGYVQVKGFCNDIALAFSDANIVVLPSYREGLPKVLIEASACGRAIVTTDVTGCRDAIIPLATGLLCKAQDVNTLVQAIEKLLKDDYLRHQMGKAGRALAEREYDIKKILKKHFIVYEE